MTSLPPRFATPAELAGTAELGAACAHLDAIAVPDLQPTRGRMIDFMTEHPDALLRTCAPGHLTGSALVLDAGSERFLLLHHTKLRRWLQPGGHADGDGNLAAVALREATEETGIEGLRVVLPAIDLDIHVVDPPREHPHEHHDVRFLVVAPPGAVATGNHESTAVRWAALDDLEPLGCDAGIRRLATAALGAWRELKRRAEPGSP